MKLYLFTLLLLLSHIFPLHCLNVLHISFHKGCIEDFKEVASELNINLSSWFVHDSTGKSEYFFDGVSKNDDVAIKYNIGHERAQRIWNKHKEYFNQFDAIVTSDTAPLCRIFLQNNWRKPLIIWVCNRFDYYDAGSLDCHFPDQEYYDLIRNAICQPNVKIVSYTPYEHEYAKRKGVDIGSETIKPIGSKPKLLNRENEKQETFFIFPRLSQEQVNDVISKCKGVGIEAVSGKYNGPDDLMKYKGILFFPYAYSNLALFENLQRGIVHFVPTKQFLLELGFVWDPSLRSRLDWCEWYFDEFKKYLVFFDSWQELKEKAATINYYDLSLKIKNFGSLHREDMIKRWKKIFNSF